MSTPAWLAAFRRPTADDRPQPLWVWNGDMDEARIEAMLDLFAAQGCGGVFIHPRAGLRVEYLSERWFALWRHAQLRCAALGLRCQIYDENSYPSGFGGGHVVAADPLTQAHFVRGRIWRDGANEPVEPVLSCADPVSGAPLAAQAWKTATPDHPVQVLTLGVDRPSLWHAGYGLPDISLPATARAFIGLVHEGYARTAGDQFGGTTQLVFSDEPTLVRPKDGLPWSGELARSFAVEHGYRLEDRAGLLFVDGPGHEAVRRDYFHTMNRMVTVNFFKAVHDWCGAHSLGYTGHVDEHLWPQPFFLPSAAAALRWMQVPGNDLLGFQFKPDCQRAERLRIALLNLRELDSVARQSGRTRTLTESTGGGGYGYGPRDMKPLEDWLMALGVSLINPHLAHESLVGARAYDWPHTMGDHAPWAADYRPHADHVARVVTALRSGTVERRVLVLMPTTSAWLHARPGLDDAGPLARIRDATLDLVDALEAAQIDYDLGDETVLAELGRVDGRLLRVGACAYQAVVVPAAMGNCEPDTLRLLTQALAAGVPVHAERACRPAFVAGRPDERPSALRGLVDHADAVALAASLRQALPPQLCAADGSALPDQLSWRRVETGDGVLFFLCNPWHQPLSLRLRLPGAGVLELDTASGDLRPTAVRNQAAELSLAPGAHVLWLCTTTAVAAPPSSPAWRPLTAAPVTAAALQPNLLVLDHATLLRDGQPPLADLVTRLDTALWTGNGFERPLWDKSIQFRRDFLDHPVGHLPGFRVVYVVQADADAPLAGIELGIEQPALWQVLVNGRPVVGPGRPWFDPGMRALPIGDLLRVGANSIELVAVRFDTRHEIAPLRLLGAFGLRATDAGFALGAERPLGLGDWGAMGRPLMSGHAAYATTVTLSAAATRMQVTLPEWAGMTWRVRFDDGEPVIAAHGESTIEIATALAAGPHRVVITLASCLFNHMGPHHGPGLPGRWSWERPWEPARTRPPAGAAWLRQPTGLLAEPRFAAC